MAGLPAFDSDDEKVTEPAAADTPESVLLARVELDAIQSALANLPVKFREIILLCDLEELSYQEIAETVGIPIGTVMSRLSRARKAMRGMLAAQSQGAQNDV